MTAAALINEHRANTRLFWKSFVALQGSLTLLSVTSEQELASYFFTRNEQGEVVPAEGLDLTADEFKQANETLATLAAAGKDALPTLRKLL
jgi:hypothetical protein